MVEIIKNLDSSVYYKDTSTLGYSFLSNYLGNSEAGAVRPFVSTDAMRFGRANHHIFLNRLIGNLVTLETHEIDKRTKAGKELAEYLEIRGEEYFKNGEQQESDIICNAFFNSYEQDPEQKEVIDVFRTRGMIELTIKWLNSDWKESHGLEFPFKSRLDACVLWPESQTAWVLDYKNDGNLDAEKLYWKYRDMNYDLQMYIYCRALMAAGYKKVKYYTLSSARETGDYCFSLYGDFDFTFTNSYKGMAFDEGERKYIEAMKKHIRIQQKLKEQKPLSHSLKTGIQLLNHPYEGEQ